MKRRKLNVSKLLILGLLLSYSANIAANTTSETTSIQQNSSYKVTGVVSDTNGEPIIGASVVEKGTSNGTITDLNPEKPDVPLNKNDAFQKVQKRRVQEKR